ncbi:MAG: HIT domain-containing protein [Candidatus Niyogibacteria bacterium]|nr:HIT domain-containing protein [Candidatus Niyogibacteria bacterium]
MSKEELKFAEGCLFCNIAKGAVHTNFVFESPEVMAFNDINPKAPVHILILPKSHIPSVREMTDADAAILGQMFIVARNIAKERDLESFKLALNVGRGAGQIVPHLHLHLLSGVGMQMP